MGRMDGELIGLGGALRALLGEWSVAAAGLALALLAAALVLGGCTWTSVRAEADGSWAFSNRAFLADATNGTFVQEPAEGGGRYVSASFEQRSLPEGESATNQTLRTVVNSAAWLGAVVSGASGNVLGTLASVGVGWMTRDKGEVSDTD